MTTRSSDPTRLLTFPQVAERYAMSRRTIERMIASGDFPKPVKIGRATRFLDSDIENHLQQLKRRAH